MKAEMKKWTSKIPDLRIRIFSLTKEENKRLDEALSQIYQIPESKRLVDHKLYMGEDYLWSEDLHLESFQKLIAKYQGKGAPPLVGVFVLAFFGVTSEKMAAVTKKHTGTVKLLTATLFLALAGLLFLLH
jgi:hypothetical protein